MKYRNLIAVVTVSSVLVISPSVFAKNGDKDKSLPPGLEKKLQRTGELPPGWQKKLAVGNVMETRVYEHSRVVVPVDRKGVITVQVEDRVVRLIQATREIVEILD
jgi:hypothetical protein